MHWFHHVHIWVVVAVCFLQRQGRSPSLHSKLPVTKQARHARWTTLQRPTFTIVWEFWSKLTSRAALKAKRKGVYSIKKKKQLAASWKRRKVSYLEPILLWLYVEEHKGAPSPAVAAFHALIPISRRALPEHLLRAKTGLSGTRGSIFCLVD